MTCQPNYTYVYLISISSYHFKFKENIAFIYIDNKQT